MSSPPPLRPSSNTPPRVVRPPRLRSWTHTHAPWPAIPSRRLEATSAAIGGIFTEAVIAPAFSPEARALLQKKRNLRLLEAVPPASSVGLEIKSLHGDLLVQEDDRVDLDTASLTVATSRAPSSAEMADLRFAWTVVKWVKSNAIVLARDGATVGIGAGQPNRVGSVEIAVKGAG